MGDVREELNRLAEESGRAEELARRLVQSGPKAAYVSASETHEISEWIIDAAPVIRSLSARAAVPEGWQLVRLPNGHIKLTKDGIGDYAKIEVHGRHMLHGLFSDLLAAAPQPAGEDEPGCDDCDGYEGEGGHCLMCGKDLSAPPEPALSAPADINSPPEFPDNCVDSSAPADVEALATEIAAYYDGKPSCPAEAELQGFEDYPPSWRFSAEKLHEFARRLSGARQAAKDGAE